jgi:hypothetical protein
VTGVVGGDRQRADPDDRRHRAWQPSRTIAHASRRCSGLRTPVQMISEIDIRAVWRRQCPQAALMVFAFALTGRSLVRWWSAARCAGAVGRLAAACLLILAPDGPLTLSNCQSCIVASMTSRRTGGSFPTWDQSL